MAISIADVRGQTTPQGRTEFPPMEPRERHKTAVVRWVRGQSDRDRAASLVVVVPVEDQLGLRDDGGELAVAAGDARLQHDGGAAAVQRHADGVRGVAL